MTWTINLVGHSDQDEQEKEVLEAAQAFADSLVDKGLSSGQFSGMFGGSTSLIRVKEDGS